MRYDSSLPIHHSASYIRSKDKPHVANDRTPSGLHWGGESSNPENQSLMTKKRKRPEELKILPEVDERDEGDEVSQNRLTRKRTAFEGYRHTRPEAEGSLDEESASGGSEVCLSRITASLSARPSCRNDPNHGEQQEGEDSTSFIVWPHTYREDSDSGQQPQSILAGTDGNWCGNEDKVIPVKWESSSTPCSRASIGGASIHTLYGKSSCMAEDVELDLGDFSMGGSSRYAGRSVSLTRSVTSCSYTQGM